MNKTIKLRNDVNIPILGLGTSLRGKTVESKEAFIESLKYAINTVGYRHIDTATCYNTEHLIATAIKECGVERQDLFITTKLYPDDMGYDKTLKAFNKSCTKLQLDYIDLYLIHFPGQPKDSKKPQVSLEKARELRLETWRALEKLYADGKVKAIGVSNYLPRHLEEIVEAKMTLPMVNQCEFHIYCNSKELFDYCNQLGIQFEGYSPLGKAKTNILNDSIVVDLAKKYSKTPAQILIRWSVQNKVVTIPQSTNRERIQENFEAINFELDQQDFDVLWTLNRNEKVSWDSSDVL